MKGGGGCGGGGGGVRRLHTVLVQTGSKPWLSCSYRLIIELGKCCPEGSAFIFDWIAVKLAGNQDRHKVSDEIEFHRIRLPRPRVPKLLLIL